MDNSNDLVAWDPSNVRWSPRAQAALGRDLYLKLTGGSGSARRPSSSGDSQPSDADTAKEIQRLADIANNTINPRSRRPRAASLLEPVPGPTRRSRRNGRSG